MLSFFGLDIAVLLAGAPALLVLDCDLFLNDKDAAAANFDTRLDLVEEDRDIFFGNAGPQLLSF